MSNADQAIKKAIEERDDLINKAEALINDADGSLKGEQKEQFDSYKDQIEEKDSYIAAKKWQAQEQARQADPYEKNNKGEQKELSSFSLSKFLMSTIPGMQDEVDSKELGFYQELSTEGKQEARNSGVQLQGGASRVLPYNVFAGGFRNDLTISTEGDDVTFDENGGFVDQLNESLVLTSIGADFLTGLTGDVKFPRETNAPTATWEGETDENAESTPTFDNVKLSPKRVGTYIDVSNQALLQTNPAIDARIKRQMVGAMRRAIETAGINGSGSSNQPEGVLNVTGIGSADVGTNGGAQAWSHWVENETNIADANADIGSLAYLTNSKVRGQAKQAKIDSGSGRFLWPVNANEVNGYQVGVSNLVPSNLSKGTGSDLSPLIFGNWNDLVIGQWGGLEVLVDPYTQATSGMTRLVINVYVDVAVLHAGSFSATQDIDTSADPNA